MQGRATQADLDRALDNVAEHMNEQAMPAASRAANATKQAAKGGRAGHAAGTRGWSRRVGDVMATSVVTVDRATPYKVIAQLLEEHRISGMPVLKMGREVAGVVTEADLLAVQARTARRLRAPVRLGWGVRGKSHPALVAGELMTAPPITIGQNSTVPSAARLMTSHHLRLLPVVDDDGKLLGVVSRRDLLTVFLRPDEDIAADVRRVLDEILLAGPGEADVSVRDGVVTLTGTLDPKAGEHGDLIPVALRLMWDVDGVVDVIDRLGQPTPTVPAQVPLT
ncbi:CBS domain-containing protein [Trebonia kvetii]|uniref:CBS domain-containing protein n=1 Tax=Trebonia kvetii TaxID=2480626 RepID=UPI0016522B62|nr:CBS domain-containing protein [Trebonia kvetii]